MAAAILQAACHMLKTGTPYRDLGPRHFEPRNRQALASRLLKRLQGLGFAVDIKEAAAAQPSQFLYSLAFGSASGMTGRR